MHARNSRKAGSVISGKQIVVVGGGLGGLSAAWQLLKAGYGNVTVLEKSLAVGGVCQTMEWQSQKGDLGPHKIFSLLPGVMDEFLSLFEEHELIRHEKRNRLFLLGSYLQYPISFGNLLKTVGPLRAGAMGASLAVTKAKGLAVKSADRSYEEYVVSRFGYKLYELVFKPLAEKVWGDPKTLSADIARTRIPASNAIDVLLRAMGLKKESTTTNAAYFYYPKDGFGAIPIKLRRAIEKAGGRVVTNAQNVKLVGEGKTITKVRWEEGGQPVEIAADLVISASPLQELPASIEGIELNEAARLAATLPLRHVLLIYIAFEKERLLDDHWIFTSDPDILFSRIYEPKVLSPQMAPQGKTMICCDVTSAEGEAVWGMSDEHLAEKCMDGLRTMKVVGATDRPYATRVVRVRNFYPRYEVGYREKLEKVIGEMAEISNIICTGRLGMYNYNNIDHCMYMGMLIAQKMKDGIGAPDICRSLLNESLHFRIVD